MASVTSGLDLVGVSPEGDVVPVLLLEALVNPVAGSLESLDMMGVLLGAAAPPASSVPMGAPPVRPRSTIRQELTYSLHKVF